MLKQAGKENEKNAFTLITWFVWIDGVVIYWRNELRMLIIYHANQLSIAFQVDIFFYVI